MNYIERGRTNYFRPTDYAALTAFFAADRIASEVEIVEDGEGRVALLFPDGLPALRLRDDPADDDPDPWEEFDLEAAIAGFVAPGEVAVLQAIGYEGMRYVVGLAAAITCDGVAARLSLEDIMDPARAAARGEVTLVQY